MGNMIRMQFQTSIVVKLLCKVIKYRFFTVATTDSTEAGFGFFYIVFNFFIPFRMNWISSCCPTPWAGCRVRSMQKRVNHCNFLCVDYRCTQQQSRVRLELVDFFVFCECVQWICSFSRSKRKKCCVQSNKILNMHFICSHHSDGWRELKLNAIERTIRVQHKKRSRHYETCGKKRAVQTSS